MPKFRLCEPARPFVIKEADTTHTRWLRQIEALVDFTNVRAGERGGWVEDTTQLSQQGNCWLYDTSALLYAGARVSGEARICGASIISHGAQIDGEASIDDSYISHHAHVTGQASVRASQVSGECVISDVARISDCHVRACQGFTDDTHLRLRIADRASVYASRIVHQAQIYGSALVSYAFVEHRAAIFDHAIIEGNEINDVWICDCAQVCERAQIIAGRGEGESPTLRYSARVCGCARVYGDCVLKHHVVVGDYAVLSGGPLLLDDRVEVSGNACVRGSVTLDDQIRVCDRVNVVNVDSETLHIHGNKVFTGEQYITRMPFYGIV